MCVGSGLVNFIVTGAQQVLIDGLPAARMTDKTMHPPPGMIAAGEASVLIGGPTVGVTLGDVAAGTALCTAARKGRNASSTTQQYGNCGVESCRQIINKVNPTAIDENTLLNKALASGNASSSPDPSVHGGTNPDQRQQILTDNGVASTQQPSSMANIMQGVAENKGVITGHDSRALYGPAGNGAHAMLVTGVQYDADGNPINVIVNDTAKGVCGSVIPIGTFTGSLRPGRAINVTDKPIY
jgi:uncharacterized Zn-binding protein involved in type VI secretion